MEEWITITKKKKEYKIINQNNLNFDEIVNIVNNVLIKYKPEYVFIYGSRARNTNKINSDVDIMVFWKYPIFEFDKFCIIKNELINELKINVDFVCMHLTNKLVKIYDERTICYYDNVSLDARCIYSAKNNRDIRDLIDYSIKLQKI